jgi:hypothetical protein
MLTFVENTSLKAVPILSAGSHSAFQFCKEIAIQESFFPSLKKRLL